MSTLTHSASSLSFVRKVLWADAATCIAAGAVMAFGGQPLQVWLGLPTTMLGAAGASLFAYAAFAAWLATRASVPRAGVIAALGINVVWAVDCAAVAFGPWFSPSALGQAFLMVQVVTVLAFAGLQREALRRPRPF